MLRQMIELVLFVFFALVIVSFIARYSKKVAAIGLIVAVLLIAVYFGIVSSPWSFGV